MCVGMFMLVCMAEHFKESRGEISKTMLMGRTIQCTIASKSKDLIQSTASLKKSVIQMFWYSLSKPSFFFLAKAINRLGYLLDIWFTMNTGVLL